MAIEPYSSIGAQQLLAEDGSYGGWLKQYKEGVFKNLKKRYVVILNKCLYIYSDYQSKTESDKFCLKSYKVENSTEVKDEAWNFKLVSCDVDKRTYYFSAASNREKEEWMEKLKVEIQGSPASGDVYAYTLEESASSILSRLSQGESPGYETSIFQGEPVFKGPTLPLMSSTGRLVQKSSEKTHQNPSEVKPEPDVASRNPLVKQLSEKTRRPPPVPEQSRKLSEPASLSPTNDRPKVPPRPIAPPRPLKQGVRAPATALSGTQKASLGAVGNFISRPLPGYEFNSICRNTPGVLKPHQEVETDESDEEQTYLECTNDEEELREIRRGVPDGKDSHPNIKEHVDFKDPLPQSAMQLSVNRDGAERLLHGTVEGTYLIRKGRDVPKVLTVFFSEKIRHFKIFADSIGECLEPSHPSFKCTKELIRHYKTHDLPNGGGKLVQPYT